MYIVYFPGKTKPYIVRYSCVLLPYVYHEETEDGRILAEAKIERWFR